MKVYIVQNCGEEIIKVFASKDKAEAFVNNAKTNEDYCEYYEVEEHLVEEA